MSLRPLTFRHGGAARRVERVTDEASVLDVRANFCNLREKGLEHYDAQGNLTREPGPHYERNEIEGEIVIKMILGRGILYGPMLPAVWHADRERFWRWMDAYREAGSTHVVYGSFSGAAYPNSEFAAVDMVEDTALLRAFFDDVVHCPAADGRGFRVVVQMDGGEDNPIPRISRDWPRVIEAIRPFLDSCLVSPGWELITASSWRSSDYSYGAKLLHQLGVRLTTAHLSIGRSSFASNPPEFDDPWNGAESGCWNSNGGEHFPSISFQVEPPHMRDSHDCHITIDRDMALQCHQHPRIDGQSTCWLDRLWDGALRAGTGYHGWRRLKFIVLEWAAWRTWHEGATPEWARSCATVMQREIFGPLGLTVGWGNGLPYTE